MSQDFNVLLCSVNIIVEDLNRSDTLVMNSVIYDEWSLNNYGSPEHPEVAQQIFDEKWVKSTFNDLSQYSNTTCSL